MCRSRFVLFSHPTTTLTGAKVAFFRRIYKCAWAEKGLSTSLLSSYVYIVPYNIYACQDHVHRPTIQLNYKVFFGTIYFMINIIKRALVRENSIKGASIILVITLTLSNVLGVFRDHFLAQKIPTDRLDIYFAAFRLPDLIFNVLILGSIAAAFVPVYSKYLKEKGGEEATKLAQATITTGVSVVAVCLVIMYFLMPSLMNLLVPSFNELKRRETVELARFLLISPFFFTISYFLGGILNSHKRFLAFSLAPLFYNLSIIICVLIFSDRLGVKGAAIGVVVGAFAHLMIQLPSAIKIGFKPIPRFAFRHPGVIKITKLMIPRAIGLGAGQILLVAYTMIASAFPGAIAIYSFADNIQTVPSVIFGNSFALAVFPTLAALSIKDKAEQTRFRGLFLKSIRAILFFLVPSTVVLLLLRAQVIRLILGYGFFGWSDTRTASATLGFFALSIIAQGLIPLVARAFYAMHNTKVPMTSSLISIFVSIVLGFIFSRSHVNGISGVAGLALGYTVGSWLNLIILTSILRRKIDISYKAIFGFIMKVIILTAFAALTIQITKEIMAASFDIDRVRFLLLQTVAALGAGALIYFGGAWLFKLNTDEDQE